MRISAFNIGATLIVTAFCWGIDRASKLYILETLALRPGDAVEAVPGILTFVMAWNYGINFGILASDGDLSRTLLALLALGVSVALLVWAARHPRDGIFATAIGLVIGGALGNGYDRMVYGAVADFLNVTCCGLNNPFAFNIADVTIFVGVAILLLRPPREGAT